MVEPWRVVELGQGITLSVVDETNRYFGDYHRVYLRVTLRYPLAVADAPAQVDLVKILERMAVSTERVESVREELIAHFIEHVARYLRVEGFAERLWRKQQAARQRPFARFG
jgi:hypothetical protein